LGPAEPERQTKTPKFYFIDTGISRVLAGLLDVPARASTSQFGDLFVELRVDSVRCLPWREGIKAIMEIS
jgi:predicted AAA+ superfamily ATPase